MFSKSPFLWHIPSTAPPHRDSCVACSVTRARVAGKNGMDIVTHVLTWEWNLEKAHRVKKTRYSRTWIEHFLFFLALMSLNGTPEAGVFKARPRWRASSRPREHSALQVAWERSTDIVPCATGHSSTSTRFFPRTQMLAMATRTGCYTEVGFLTKEICDETLGHH